VHVPSFHFISLLVSELGHSILVWSLVLLNKSSHFFSFLGLCDVHDLLLVLVKVHNGAKVVLLFLSSQLSGTSVAVSKRYSQEEDQVDEDHVAANSLNLRHKPGDVLVLIFKPLLVNNNSVTWNTHLISTCLGFFHHFVVIVHLVEDLGGPLSKHFLIELDNKHKDSANDEEEGLAPEVESQHVHSLS
jgi:hypothetical protein